MACEIFPEDDMPAADDPCWWELDETPLGWADPVSDHERLEVAARAVTRQADNERACEEFLNYCIRWGLVDADDAPISVSVYGKDRWRLAVQRLAGEIRR